MHRNASKAACELSERNVSHRMSWWTSLVSAALHFTRIIGMIGNLCTVLLRRLTSGLTTELAARSAGVKGLGRMPVGCVCLDHPPWSTTG